MQRCGFQSRPAATTGCTTTIPGPPRNFALALWKSLTGQTAAAAPPLSPEPLHSPAYNISLNFSSIIAFPSRLLARIRKADDFLFQDAIAANPSLNGGRSARYNQLSGRVSDLGGSVFPGPYGFFLSGYMVGILALAILMHRIQNIVVPSRSSSNLTSHSRGRNIYGYSTVRRLYAFLLPLDLTRTATRLAFHLPSLYFLSKMLLTWTIILLQTSSLFPPWDSGYIFCLGQWTQRMEMRDVCWRTFCAICAAFSMEAFVRGLDGGGLGLIQMNANTSPFNLIGYAFLLHIYSSPITHVYKPESFPSRPDKHVIVTITIPLLQLTIFHILSIRKRWSNHRLFPTALSSILSLLHFHTTLYSHYYARTTLHPRLPDLQPKVKLEPSMELPSHPVPSFPAPTPPPSGPVPPPPVRATYSRPSGSATFPLLNYVPNAFETLLISTITLTVVLNALTQLILTGRVERPLLGLGLAGTSGAWTWAPPYDEDWGVILLRVGTASLEATGLRGWGNEMPAVPIAPAHPQYGTARLGPTGVVAVSSGYGAPAVRRYRRRGLENEVRAVDIGAGGVGTFGADLINLRWLKEAWRFLGIAWVVARRLVVGLWWYISSGGKSWGGYRGTAAAVNLRTPSDVVEEVDEAADQDELMYDRFLRQEEISDDEEDSAPQQWDMGDSSSEDEEGHEAELDRAEAVDLYTDLDGASAATPVLLAHMTRYEESPLTRRRYSSLVGSRTPPAAPLIASPVRARPPAQPLEETRRNCVICTCDPREIICWPCRCLSMCDGCREVLASRSSASKHRCPCCRQTVEGYSRIYIP
ncbi:hypothetical protein B0H15DRAFT_916541 [Mycena belliarum]|uniref:RING-type domain-containing protein n=1 Tax=Mycena belliarum TaxID=1033014 RepID=A0AAD6XJX4_9AGAR|nr:hypothetical protein B0H15DRAFT_916541 [Mycena belliae]